MSFTEDDIYEAYMAGYRKGSDDGYHQLGWDPEGEEYLAELTRR